MQTAFSASTEQVLVHLLLQIAVILAVSRVTGEVFRRLGQSHSIGEILSGVMLGPSLLGWMAPETFTWIFRPEGPVLLPYLSHLGLVLALFLIGMEFDFRTVRPHLGKVSSTAIATLLAPMAAAAALAPWLWSIAPGQGSYEAYTLFVGLVMAITAIPIMGRLLMEQGLTRTRMGVLAITSGAAKDVVTWLLLAVVSGIARPPLDPWHVGAMVLGTVLLALNSLTLVRWLIGWGQERFGWEGDRPSGALITFLLVILVLQAAASAEIGIFAILGAFLTGVSVSSDRRLSEAVADRLHDLTFYLFLPIFFTYTGLRCDLTELAGRAVARDDRRHGGGQPGGRRRGRADRASERHAGAGEPRLRRAGQYARVDDPHPAQHRP